LQSVVKVDPKFLRNMRFAKKHNVKHLKQKKVWVESTEWLIGVFLNWKTLYAYSSVYSLLLWINAVLHFCYVM